jgi:hypothetical protein
MIILKRKNIFWFSDNFSKAQIRPKKVERGTLVVCVCMGVCGVGR